MARGDTACGMACYMCSGTMQVLSKLYYKDGRGSGIVKRKCMC